MSTLQMTIYFTHLVIFFLLWRFSLCCYINNNSASIHCEEKEGEGYGKGGRGRQPWIGDSTLQHYFHRSVIIVARVNIINR